MRLERGLISQALCLPRFGPCAKALDRCSSFRPAWRASVGSLARHAPTCAVFARGAATFHFAQIAFLAKLRHLRGEFFDPFLHVHHHFLSSLMVWVGSPVLSVNESLRRLFLCLANIAWRLWLNPFKGSNVTLTIWLHSAPKSSTDMICTVTFFDRFSALQPFAIM